VPGAVAVVVTSAATGEGLAELSRELLRHVPLQETGTEPFGAHSGELAEHKVYRPADDSGYKVERGPDGVLRVVGPAVERLLARHDIHNDEALRYVEERLRKMGVIRALEQAGFEPGDDVELAGTVFELDPGSPFR
jgi:GTP-binding protein